MSTKLSVVIPVFNTEKYLKECLDSVVNQTLKEIEIICINDGSTDNSLQILQEYAQKDERIKIINQENSGAGIARNKGIHYSIGQFIYFLDSDDYIVINCLEKMYNKIKETNADICLCYQNDILTENNEHSKNVINRGPNNGNYIPNQTFNSNDCPNTIFQICTIAPFNKLYNKDFLQKYNIEFQSLKSCNDVFFNYATLASAHKITAIKEPLVYHRKDLAGSITSKRGKTLNNIVIAMIETKRYLKSINKYKLLKESYYKRFLTSINYELTYCSALSPRLKFKISLIKMLKFKDWLSLLLKELTYICSITNLPSQDGKWNKVIYIMGLKFSFRNKKKEEQMKKLKESSEK